jgi:ADP-ribose pyrophosphatase
VEIPGTARLDPDEVLRRVGVSREKKAQILEKIPLYEGFLKLYRYRFEVERHDGGTRIVQWEMMERGRSVGVLGHDPNRDEIVLVNELRPGVLVTGGYPFRDQLVAGVVEGEESATDAAAREMREEAGLELSNPVLIHPGAYVSSGGTSEQIALVYGTVDTSQAGGTYGTDASEDTLVVVQPVRTFLERVRSGAVEDFKTLLAGYWLAERLKR